MVEGRGSGAEQQNRALDTRHSTLDYSLALLFFALGLMSKPMLVTLPFVLLLLDYWPLRRFELPTLTSQPSIPPRLLWEKSPFLLLTIASCIVTFFAQYKGEAVAPMDMIPIRSRIANALIAYASYLLKMIWPQNLAVFYPHPVDWPAANIVGALLLLICISVVAVCLRRRSPYLLMGWLWYLGTLVPVIGLIQVGSQSMADRYTYVPLIGVFVMIAWGAADLVSRWRHRQPAVALVGGLALAGCVVSTNLQVRYWQDSLTLFRHALEVDPESPLSQRNLGQALSERGEQKDALVHLEKALELKPDFPLAHVNLGNSLNLLGRLDEAIAHYNEAIDLKPGYEMAHYQLANALVVKGRVQEAEIHFQAALQSKPDYAEAHTKLANLLILEGRQDEAMPHYFTAIKSNPDYEEGYYYLATVLARQRKFEEAVAYFQFAIKLKPDNTPVLNDLAWILATTDNSKTRNVPDAIRLAQRACELTHRQNPKYLDTLAVAYSEKRQFADAIAATRQAVTIAESAGQKSLAATIESRLKFYQQGHSYREISNLAP
jgi:tetratricopeptide (TPR) repeat protein